MSNQTRNALESLLHNLRYCSHKDIVYCFNQCDKLNIPYYMQNRVIALSEDKQRLASNDIEKLLDSIQAPINTI